MGSTLPKSSEKAICLGRWESPWNQGGIFRGDLLVSGRISETPFRINGFPCYFFRTGWFDHHRPSSSGGGWEDEKVKSPPLIINSLLLVLQNSQGQPPGIYKNLVSNRISTTDLNWLYSWISEPSTGVNWQNQILPKRISSIKRWIRRCDLTVSCFTPQS